jgi:hypothetical protein
MKTRILLVVALCVALAVGFTVASDKASKGCGCGMKDQVISLNDTGFLPDDAQLTGLTSAFPKCPSKIRQLLCVYFKQCSGCKK